MPRAENAGTFIEYDTIGDPGDPALLLIMGLGAQLTSWEDGFCRLLADQGLFVIRFDNRDCGLSSKTSGPLPDAMSVLTAYTTGQKVGDGVPYSLSDMVGDGLAVMDELGIGSAHVAGASMGGMIAQQMAIERPDRVLSLCSIMSTTGHPSVGQSTPEALAVMFAPPPPDRDSAIERSLQLAQVISGPLFDEARARERLAAAYDRSFHPDGVVFQLCAIAKTGDRTAGLRTVEVPAQVIHGKVDPLIQLSGGEATAAAIGGAKLVLFDEMGHDLPRPLWTDITSAIADHALAGAVGP
jgi:pimeloyl-ACP methyl ester carboxylesterase